MNIWLRIVLFLSCGTWAVAMKRHFSPVGSCLDGSPVAFYLSKGLSDNTIIFLQGGGMCTTHQDCLKRSKDPLGSSKSYPKSYTHDNGGFLSRNPFKNPAFFSWTFVYVPYCSGDFYTGNQTGPRQGLYYQGYINIMGILDQLPHLNPPTRLKPAPKIVVSGCSAGSVGAMLLVDSVAQRFPQSHVSTASTGGWLTTGKNCTGTVHPGSPYHWDIVIKAGYQLWGRPFLPPACLAANPAQPWKCYDFAVASPFIKSRVFIAETLFDVVQAAIIDGCPFPAPNPAMDAYLPYMAKLLGERITTVRPQISFFAPACQGHCQDFDKKINGVSLGKAVSTWLKGDTVRLQETCLQLSCAPKC